MIPLILSVLTLVIIAAAVVEIVQRHRQMQQHALLWALATTVDRGMPLVHTLDACAQEFGGLYGAHVAEFSAMLRQGINVPEALASQRKVFPVSTLPLLQVGFATGTPGKALRQALSTMNTRSPAIAIAARITYLAIFALVATSILAYIMWKIMPAFVKIFQEFDQELPPATAMLSGFFGQVLMNLGVLGFLIMVLLLASYCFLRRFGFIEWDPPGIRRLTWRPHAAAILDGLALAVENRQPLSNCLEAISQTYPQGAVRMQLSKVAGDLQASVPCWKSFLARGLIGRADRALLQAAERAGNLAWALGEVAAGQRRRWMYQMQTAVNLLYPVVILLMGAFVLWVMVALFSPPVELIHILT